MLIDNRTSKRTFTCCFIGSEVIPSGDERKILSRVDNRLYPLLNSGVIYCGISYTPGFCQLVGKHLLDLRAGSYKRLKIIMVQPQGGFLDTLSDEQKRAYFAFYKSVDKVVEQSVKPPETAAQACDRHLVDGSAYCISYITSKTDCGAAGVKYALEHEVKVYNASQWDIRYL